MSKLKFAVVFLIIFFGTLCIHAGWLAIPVQAENAPYVNAAVADTEFSSITAQCMDVIRSKKILLASYSWGLGMRSGLYTVPDDYGSIYNTVGIHYASDYDVRAAGTYNVIPSNAFEVAVVPMLVHYIGLGSGHTVGEFDNLIRNGPWYFKNVIDVAMVFGDDNYDNYLATFDALRFDFPNIKFIYTTSGLGALGYPYNEWRFTTYNPNIRAMCKGVVPLYDYEYIVNDDGRCGAGYCPEYSTDPAGIHPNTRFINNRAAKGFLLVLSKLFCVGTSPTDITPPSIPTNLTATAVSSSQINLSWTASTDNVGVTGYRVESCSGSACTNFVQIGIPTGTTYSNTGLSTNTAYRYRVRAADAAGNLSGYSAIAGATTQSSGATGPVAWWKFDETSGTTAADSSGSNYTGTLVNGPVWMAGKIGNALSFDGVNDYVNANIPSLSSITISAWAKTPIAGLALRIIDANGTAPLLRFVNSSAQFIGSIFLTSNTTFLSNQWYHLAAVGDANGHKLYVNGSLDNSNSTAYTVSNGNPILIGGSIDLFNGLIDEVRIYNRALSAAEVQILYQEGASDTTPPSPPTNVVVS